MRWGGVYCESMTARGTWWSPFPLSRLAAMLIGSAALSTPMVALGQQATTLNGPPIQVTPYVGEPGVPTIVIPTGTPTPPSTGNGSGGGTSGGSDVLTTLLGTTWGAQAIAEAQALGVNPTALAATCVLESGCQNVGGSGAQGAFQMFPSAYQDGLKAALAANPSLASQIVPGSAGMNDPATEAIAAAGYQMLAVQSLQASGISNPTVLDTRSYYEFGPRYGAPVANANPSTPLVDVVPQSFLTKNNIPSSTTVGQWQTSVANKIGNAAGQTVML